MDGFLQIMLEARFLVQMFLRHVGLILSKGPCLILKSKMAAGGHIGLSKFDIIRSITIVE